MSDISKAHWNVHPLKTIRLSWREGKLTLLNKEPQPRRTPVRKIVEQLENLPQGLYEAHRYDTDDEMVLHLWNEQGESFDIAIRKRLSR